MLDGIVRTRFAPSPTGALHAGTVRTALFAWLAARHYGGQFILRIEDTDKSREVKDGLQNITDSLNYLGLDWDEGPGKDGPYGPYTQSQRLDIYRQWGQKLADSGRAYADISSPEDVEKLRQNAKEAKKPFLFRDSRPGETPSWEYGKHPLRFKSDPKSYEWHDVVMGDLSTGPEVVDDFILIKSDGYPTYNFAHIIDDHLMKISHVVRSQEFLSSMPNFLNLYDSLETQGVKRPLFVTVPNVLNAEGNKKLSKRFGAPELLEYRRMGILPEALMNNLATTGWNDGTEQEIFSVNELIEKFDLSRVQRSGAHFDEKRLEWMNGHYIRELPREELYEKAENFWPTEAKNAEPQYKKVVLALVQERLKYLGELAGLTKFFFAEPTVLEVMGEFSGGFDKHLKKVSKEDKQKYLKAAYDELQKSDFSESDIRKRLNDLLQTLNTKPGILFALVRISVSGLKATPEIFGTLAVLGKDKSLARIKKAQALLDSQA